MSPEELEKMTPEQIREKLEAAQSAIVAMTEASDSLERIRATVHDFAARALQQVECCEVDLNALPAAKKAAYAAMMNYYSQLKIASSPEFIAQFEPGKTYSLDDVTSMLNSFGWELRDSPQAPLKPSAPADDR